MDLHLRRGGGFLRWSVMMIVFMFILADNKPNKVVASSRRTSFTLLGSAPSPSPHSPSPSPSPSPPPTGMCESSVIIWGYQCQEFYVTTEDGYVINMQRISTSGGGRSSGGGGGKVNKQPVLLQHGILVDGMIWLLSTHQSLGFILADSGFDVWIVNTRGTRYSRGHEYWNWSWDELVQYDHPAIFEFVYNQTRQKLHYVGHSLGTTVALAAFSEGKSVDKLRSAALLSPVAYISHISQIAIIGAKSFLCEIAMVMGVVEFNLKEDDVANFINSLCVDLRLDCYELISEISGNNYRFNDSTLDLFWKDEPQATSTKTMVHLTQNVRDGTFSKFNYGSQEMNIEHYGQEKPPIYNLSNIPRNLPLFLGYGGQDNLADLVDVKKLLEKLKLHKIEDLTTLFINGYAHNDFPMGSNAKDKVYDPLISFFGRH
ncbi:triacylglycerol lipase 2-like isoform X3 [Macadamia integrifolia]|uniref:triacylglycerol lipase 2-like isoform X3 n=1 Tax=Macadamia integrifolia TaxID=60698 RepID=UPI001C4FB5D8|nr:triacylglycerol lipase 2-like isoform X3 [Macadamia integrifolia]